MIGQTKIKKVPKVSSIVLDILHKITEHFSNAVVRVDNKIEYVFEIL